MKRIALCLNCLDNVYDSQELWYSGTEVGPSDGNQRDPIRQKIELCKPCHVAIVAGDMRGLHDRYRESRTVGHKPTVYRGFNDSNGT